MKASFHYTTRYFAAVFLRAVSFIVVRHVAPYGGSRTVFRALECVSFSLFRFALQRYRLITFLMVFLKACMLIFCIRMPTLKCTALSQPFSRVSWYQVPGYLTWLPFIIPFREPADANSASSRPQQGF